MKMNLLYYHKRRIFKKPSAPSQETDTLIRLLEGIITNSYILDPVNSFSFFFFPAFLYKFMLFAFSDPGKVIDSPFTKIIKDAFLLKIQADK